MLVLPIFFPNVDGALEALFDATLLSILAGPVILWRVRSAVRRHQIDVDCEVSASPGKTIGATVTVLALGLTFSVLAVLGANRGVRLEARAHFEQLAERIVSEVQSRANRIVYGLKGARGVYAASQSVERAEFENYVASRDLSAEFPGAIGMGFIERVMREDVDAFLAAERADGAPDFQIKNMSEFAADSLASAGEASSPDLFVIKHIFPLEPNRAAWGLDIGSESVRREAAERAVRTGEPTISGRISLVQDARKRTGFLYFVPVYRNGVRTTTPEERENALVGLLYAPMILEEALTGLFESARGEIDFEIFDRLQVTGDARLFDCDGHLGRGQARVSTELQARRILSQSIEINVGGRKWTVITNTTPSFDTTINRTTPYVIGAGGCVLSLLLSAFAFSLLTARSRAVVLAHGMTNDLATAKAAAENALRETLAFRTTLDQHSIISVTNTRGCIIDVNPPFCAISGYSKEELLGNDHRMLNSGAHPRAFWRDVWRVLAAGAVWRGEICNKAKGGSLYWVDCIIAPFMDADGNIERYVMIGHDITERKHSEESLRQVTDRLALAVRAGGVGIWDYDVVNNRLVGDDQMYRLYGIAPGQSCGEYDGWRARVHPDDRPRCDEEIGQALAGDKEFDTEFRVVWPDGTIRNIRAIASVQRDAAGDPLRLVGTNWDITAQKESEASLRETNRNLEETTARANQLTREARALAAEAGMANAAKSEFLANMSHEIRTPMTAILGYADVIAEHCSQACRTCGQDFRGSIETIKRNGEHLLRIINDILDLSKIEAEKMTVEQVPVSLSEIIDDVSSLMRIRAESRALEFRCEFVGLVPETIHTDPLRLRQILINLLGNAIKFTESGSVRLVVQVMREKDVPCVQFDVIDTGIGMTSEQVEEIFKPFAQADTTTTRQFGGTGLGLTISKRLANLLGGDVRLIHTQLGVGTTYRVFVSAGPLDGVRMIDCETRDTSGVSRNRVSPATSSHLDQFQVLDGARVLLAEDGPDNQRLISFHLRKVGAIVDVAENGRIAMELLNKAAGDRQPYDLLLTDMQMPKMDGYTLARTLRQEGWTLPIVALTAHAMTDDSHKCIEAGCDDYASKPIDKASLLAKCATWIGKAGGKVLTAQAE